MQNYVALEGKSPEEIIDRTIWEPRRMRRYDVEVKFIVKEKMENCTTMEKSKTLQEWLGLDYGGVVSIEKEFNKALNEVISWGEDIARAQGHLIMNGDP